MPTPQELELLALLSEERRRNATAGTPQPVAAALPDLTPEMLLSVAAQREVEAARSFTGRVEARLSPREVRASRAPMERAGFDMSGGLEMSLGDDMGDIDLDASEMTSAARVTPNDDALLSSLFMGREAQEAQAVLGGGGNYAASGYDIEFDADSMLEGRTSPNEVARFQVGRQSPPRMPFSAARLEGPSDGTIVSRREGGSWQRTAAAETPRLTIQAHAGQPQSGTNNNNGGNLDFTRSLREAYAVPPPRPAPAPRPTVSRQNIPSVYQRIMRGGAFDDD